MPLDRRAIAIGLVTVVAANWLYLAGLSRVLDPMLSMEPFYIDLAQQPVTTILREDPAWGPIYAFWLKPFRAVLDDPIVVYGVNLYVLSLALSTLIYAYLVLLTRSAVMGVGGALVFLVSDLNVPLASKVISFSLLLVLTGLLLAEVVRSRAAASAVVGAGTLLAAYARPELYPAAVVLVAWSCWRARIEQREVGWRAWLWPAAATACLFALAVALGTPIFSPYHDNERAWIAFREHFAWNWIRWHDQSFYFASIWEREFGAAETVFEAVRVNPAAIAHHFADNAVGTATFLLTSPIDHYPFLAPANRPALVTVENVLASAALFGSIGLVAFRADWRRRFSARYGHLLLPWTVLAVSAFGAATVIYPLPHYLAIPCVLLLLTGVLAATIVLPVTSVFSWRVGMLSALGCLLAIPKPFILPSAYAVPGSPFKAQIDVTHPVTDTVQFIRSLGLQPPVHLLTVPDGLGELLGSGFHEVKIWQKGKRPLEEYIRDNQIDLIATAEPGRISFVIDDPYWEQIQIDPKATGFTLLTVPNHRIRVYVRTQRLANQPGAAGATR